ncbi:hypothetical protein L1987_63906 [Smallanthus sonchifolius]|uniref:Uncharacterized protein n=1 Tax=Smallanthus sonchifolius TaxID=185202 RepID=A0ACB9CEJ2_9ASTR|nr:hypothetical protein L1987_63906 [Smallanthus sonchifolius]
MIFNVTLKLLLLQSRLWIKGYIYHLFILLVTWEYMLTAHGNCRVCIIDLFLIIKELIKFVKYIKCLKGFNRDIL